MKADARAILDYWSGLGPAGWFARSDAVDREIAARFGADWRAVRDCPADELVADADTALAHVVLLDQFPRNMFRGTAEAFATDPLARAVADLAIARGYDRTVDPALRLFFYLPFEHSEALTDQDRAVALIDTLGDEDYSRFARAHRDMILRFGRFPHRNAALGRADRPGEAEAVAAGGGW